MTDHKASPGTMSPREVTDLVNRLARNGCGEMRHGEPACGACITCRAVTLLRTSRPRTTRRTG